MRSTNPIPISRLARREGSALLAALLACACATTEPTHSAAVEVRDESGFTITEDVHAGAGVRGDFASAVRLLEQERYAEGIPLLQEVAESAPDATTVLIDLGIAYGRVGDVEHAEASLQKALELNPRHPVARNELGIVYRQMGRFADARAELRAGARGVPGVPLRAAEPGDPLRPLPRGPGVRARELRALHRRRSRPTRPPPCGSPIFAIEWRRSRRTHAPHHRLLRVAALRRRLRPGRRACRRRKATSCSRACRSSATTKRRSRW